MRDRGDNREFRYRRHHHHHHHVDRNSNSNSNSDATRRHKPPPRLVRLSGSPPIQIQAPHRSSSYRRDLIDHHQEYPSPHHPRRRRRYHSPTVGDYHDDLHVPGYMHPHPDYPTDLSHGLDPHPRPHPHPLAGHKSVLLDDRPPSRSYPETLKQDSILDDMLPGGIHDIDLHHRHGHNRELYGGDRVRDRDRDRDRGRDRDTGKSLYQREVPHPHPHPHPVTVTTTLDGGQSSYGHGRLCYEHTLPAPEDISRAAFGRLPDDLRKSRDRVTDHYNNLALDDMYGKMPYTSHDCFRVDGTAYSPKTVREGRVYNDLPHHSTHKDVGPIYHGFKQGSMARPLHRRDAPLPFEDSYKFQREVARVAEREIPQSPIFPDCAKRLHHTFYSPSHNEYANDLGYEPSLERMMAREHQLRHVHDHDHDHVHNNVIYDDSIFEDDDDDVGNDNNSDEDGHVSNPRITVKDRLNLPSPLLTEVDHPIIRRAGPFRKPVVIHGKHHHSQKMAVPAAMRTNSVKKRLQLGPSDLRRENFRAHKLQRRGMEDEPNIRKVNYEYENCPDEDAANTELRDPLEGSEEFNKQVEKAFFKYAKIINGSSREKKKFLQPGKGSVVCCVCGRQSKEFAETHNLVVHAFHTRKPGLRAAHLGLQKALCLLMGWNWLISPDESRQYQVGPPKEAKVLKQDLILWPPIVVIRNSSIDNSASKSKTISIDMIRSMLKEMGIEEGKAKVSYGKPSNLSVILVKFPPIRSGFELAGKLHNHFYQAKHGKEHLHDLLKSGNSTTSNKKANEKEIEDVLYGYMAGIEDLENLDSDTKKTYLAGKDTIRSKKVMEARANEEAAA